LLIIFFWFYLFLIVCVLVRVAFITLLERKILGYIQIRKGPNKVGYEGVIQPFADAVKLFTKENNFLTLYNKIIYFLSPVLSLILILRFWVIFPWRIRIGLKYEFLIILVISRLRIYVILGSGWGSNSKYSILGAYRGVAQTVSYEVGFSFILLRLLVISMRFRIIELVLFQQLVWCLFGFCSLFLLWIVTILAETNRTPFDFAEGESELVSGFNVEYGGGGFAILFMAEYGNIIFIRAISSVLFLGGYGLFCYKLIFVSVICLWVRGTLVRFRYDKLIILAWKVILPYRIFFFIMCY